jgi:hypothetical protein
MNATLSIHFTRVKAHNGIEGNELADILTKEAAEDDGQLNIVHNRTPITTIATGLKKEGNTKWQRQRESTDKGALCRSCFPTTEQTKIENTHNIRVHSYWLWPWENKIISPQVQINRQCNVPLR